MSNLDIRGFMHDPLLARDLFGATCEEYGYTEGEKPRLELWNQMIQLNNLLKSFKGHTQINYPGGQR